jgi:hypothetical protein
MSLMLMTSHADCHNITEILLIIDLNKKKRGKKGGILFVNFTVK